MSSSLEHVSKAGATASALLIAGFLLAFHPDMTWPLTLAAAAALLVGWTAGARQPSLLAFWVGAAPLMPAMLRTVAGREGPVLDFLWMAGLTASLVRASSWSRWSLPSSWRVPAGGWALTLTLAWPVLLTRETGWDFALLRDNGAVHSSGLLSAPDVAGWTMFVVWTHLLGLLWLDRMVVAFTTEARLEPGTSKPVTVPPAVHGLWIGATLAALVGLYQGVVDLGFGSTSFWSALGRATGTLLDANAFGITAALAGPVAFLALYRPRAPGPDARAPWSPGPGHWACWIVLMIGLGAVWMSGSRTAALAAVVGTSALVAAVWRSAGEDGRAALARGAAALVLVAALLVVAAGTTGPFRRLFERPDTTDGALAAVFNRGPYGTTAMRMIRDYPLTGVGTGSYEVLSADYWRLIAGQALRPDDAQNWWRHQAAELGLLGGLSLFVWSALVAWAVIARAPDTGSKLESTTLRGLVAAVGVCSLIQVPTQVPIVLLWFLSLVAWLSSLLVAGRSRPLTLSWPRGSWVLAGSLAVAYASGHLMLARGSLAPVERASHARREYITGSWRPEPTPESTEFRWTGRQSRFRWPARTRWLVARIWAPHADIERDPVRLTITSPCTVLFDDVLRDAAPIRLALVVRDGADLIDVSLAVSRTWQPSSALGGGDTRRLGVGIATDFAGGEEDLADVRRIDLPACRQSEKVPAPVP